ncbi:hypothetical protein ACFFRR_004352 [Megaselia abdita]
MFHTVVILFLVILLAFTNVRCEKEAKNSNSREKRWLIFPQTSPTRTQFIAGIGIPVEDLAFESITTGYVFKAEYYLPHSAEQWHQYSTMNIGNLPIQGRKRRDANSTTETKDPNDDLIGYVDETEEEEYIESLLNKQKVNKLRGGHNDLGKYRWSIYKGIEILANKMGLVGRSCILRTICEAAETPFHIHGGILSELVHILMSPSTSNEDIVHHADNEYYHAENLGRSGAPCAHVFRECKRSLLQQFSGLYEMSNDIIKILG